MSTPDATEPPLATNPFEDNANQILPKPTIQPSDTDVVEGSSGIGCCGWIRWFRSRPKPKLDPAKHSLCLQCKARISKSSFCSSSCIRNARSGSYGSLVELPASHARFGFVSSYFHERWKNKNVTVCVHHIYKIVFPDAQYREYKKYRSSIARRGKFRFKCQKHANEVLTWHGTIRDCTLGDEGNSTLCSNAACRLCKVISCSYKMTYARGGTYGKGIYTSPSSSMSHGYVRNKPSSRTNCLLLNRVVAGVSTGASNGRKGVLPKGYHSLLVDTASYDQLVIYKEEAIRPAYLVVYGNKPLQIQT